MLIKDSLNGVRTIFERCDLWTISTYTSYEYWKSLQFLCTVYGLISEQSLKKVGTNSERYVNGLWTVAGRSPKKMVSQQTVSKYLFYNIIERSSNGLPTVSQQSNLWPCANMLWMIDERYLNCFLDGLWRIWSLSDLWTLSEDRSLRETEWRSWNELISQRFLNTLWTISERSLNDLWSAFERSLISEQCGHKVWTVSGVENDQLHVLTTWHLWTVSERFLQFF